MCTWGRGEISDHFKLKWSCVDNVEREKYINFQSIFRGCVGWPASGGPEV